MKRASMKMKKGQKATTTNNDDVRVSAEEEAQLDDILHSYGGPDAIHISKDSTPAHVLQAYND